MGSLYAKVRYEVLIGGEWRRASKADKQPSGWLHAKFRDGTTTLVPPSKWRALEPKPTRDK